ncbi:MAG: hypothetical protein ACLQRH_18940 [Acidimicrobiales bacterium]
MTAIEVTEKIQGGVLKAVETSQAWTLGALKSTSSAFDSVAVKPDPSLVPFADKIPTAAETLDLTFGFWSKLLDAQHSFLSGVVDIYVPSPAKVVPAAAKKV